MADVTRGLLDTSVLIDHDLIDPVRLLDEAAIAAISLAELAAGPHATADEAERARIYGRVFATVRAAAGRVGVDWRTC